MRLRWTKRALWHLSCAGAYVAQDSFEAASALVRRIEEAAEALRRYPFMGKGGRIAQTRELVVPGTPYFLAYRVTDDSVEVVGVIHGARRWP